MVYAGFGMFRAGYGRVYEILRFFFAALSFVRFPVVSSLTPDPLRLRSGQALSQFWERGACAMLVARCFGILAAAHPTHAVPPKSYEFPGVIAHPKSRNIGAVGCPAGGLRRLPQGVPKPQNKFASHDYKTTTRAFWTRTFSTPAVYFQDIFANRRLRGRF